MAALPPYCYLYLLLPMQQKMINNETTGKKDVPTYITFKIGNVYKTKMKLVYSKLLANTHEPVHRMFNRTETDKPR